MQSLKKNWLLVPKMTWEIRWTLTRGSMKICSLISLLLSIPYKVSARKTQKSYLSWHWSLIQALKKNWLFGWNMTWGIWWVLTRALESLKVYTLMGYSYHIKHKKYRGVVLWKINYGFKSDMRYLVSFYTSSWK